MRGKFKLFAIFILSLSALGLASGFLGDFASYWGPRYQQQNQIQTSSGAAARQSNVTLIDWVRHWNEVAVNASGLDHTPVKSGDLRVFGEQFGPVRAGRAMAIVHIAMFDAVNAIVGGYQSYTHQPAAPRGATIRAALGQAACDTLTALYPSQKQAIRRQLARDLKQIRNGRAKSDGIEVGHRAAAAILQLRAFDGSQHPEPRVGVDFITSNQPGKWRQDPISKIPLALGAHWSEVQPFVLKSAQQFRIPPPPSLNSPKYRAAFNEVKRLGGDAKTTHSERTDDQTMAGLFWAYDGTPTLCAPPRLYNQITVQIAKQRGSTAVELVRLLALVNTALADSGIAVWESKYYYQFWRPITGIREARSPGLVADRTFSPMGAPVSNLNGPNFTPPFPSYPSGHAGLGGSVFETLRRFYRTDKIAFTFISDELNGVTLDNAGLARPLRPRHFSSLSQAEEENGQSRIYLGIHWSFDKTEGIKQGRKVADFVFNNAFRPLDH
jgi:hypothetical protein